MLKTDSRLIETFFDFEPLGALLDPRTSSLISYKLQNTTDKVLKLRQARTTIKHIAEFASAKKHFLNDKEFAQQLLEKRDAYLVQLSQISESAIKCNLIIIKGDWDLEWDLRKIVEDVSTTWIESVSELIETGKLSRADEIQFGKILHDYLSSLANSEDKLLHYKANDLVNDKYLTYFLNLKDTFPVAIRRNLFKLKNRSNDVEPTVESYMHIIDSQTSLLQPSWRNAVEHEIDLEHFISDIAKRQLLDILLAESVKLIPSLREQDGLQILESYNDSKKALHSLHSIGYTPDKSVMNKVRNRWTLNRRYVDVVLTSSLSHAPLTPDDYQFIAQHLRDKIDRELSKETLKSLNAIDLHDLAGDFSMQGSSSLVLGDLSGFYANITWPQWVVNMAGYPDMAVKAILDVIIPSIISGSIEAYIGWRLANHIKAKRQGQNTIAAPSNNENIRVTSFVCKELLKYKYYLFDKSDLNLAKDVAQVLAANFAYLSNLSNIYLDPNLTDDLNALGQLMSKEATILSRKKSKSDRVKAIFKNRIEFCKNLNIMGIMLNRAELIVQEHIEHYTGIYDRSDSTTKELSDLSKTDKKRTSAEAKITAERIMSINAPYILTLAIKHFLSSNQPETDGG